VPELVVDRLGETEQGRRGVHPQGPGDLGDDQAGDPIRVIHGQRVADEVPGVVADHGEPLVAEGVHQRDQVVGQGAGVVPVLGFVGQADTALVDCDDLEVPGQLRHQQAPGVPVLRPAVHQQQRRAVTSDDRVLAQSAGVYVPAGERVGEPIREVRRAGDGAGAFRGGQVGGG
jgi:hypothetical protein